MGYHHLLSHQHSGGVHGDLPHHGLNIINNGHHCLPQQLPTIWPMLMDKITLRSLRGLWGTSQPTTLQWPVTAHKHTRGQGNQTKQLDQQAEDLLINALAVSTVLGKQYEPILSMHVSQSLKKWVWAGEYIDLAYLLETNPVPKDEKSCEFACTSNATNKLSLSTAKPKVKIDSYNSWNKAYQGVNWDCCTARSITVLTNGAMHSWLKQQHR